MAVLVVNLIACLALINMIHQQNEIADGQFQLTLEMSSSNREHNKMMMVTIFLLL